MTIKQKKQKVFLPILTKKIDKKKTTLAHLNSFIRQLKKNNPDITSKQYLNRVHLFAQKLIKKNGPIPYKALKKIQYKFKICKTCDQWATNKKMISCFSCEDYFHLKCAKDWNKGDPSWICQSCYQVALKRLNVQKQLQKQTKPKKCEKCNKQTLEQTIKCLKCSKFFHKQCYGNSNIVCQDCNINISNKQINIMKSSNIGKRDSCFGNKSNNKQILKVDINNNSNTNTKTQLISKQINQSTQSSTIVFSNYKKFTAKFPQMTDQQIKKYKQSLLFAILSKNLQYSQELVCHDCSLFQGNQDSIDFDIQHLSYSDTKMFKEYKKQPIGPFIVEYKQQCGFNVVADKDLPKGMIICQYIGDVYTYRQALKLQKNDSVFTFVNGMNADYTLLIVPLRYTNIARFLNGVNENDEQKKIKQNVIAYFAYYEGRPIVVLHTSRCIKKGESLLYDYNGGRVKEDASYDTTKFAKLV